MFGYDGISFNEIRVMTTRKSLVPACLSMLRVAPLMAALILTVSHAIAAPLTHIQVKVITGAVELTAGSFVELRIYEAGKAVRHLALTHDEVWPRDSTLVIPLTLTEALDPRGVLRFGLYYRAVSPLTPPWEVVSAEVDLAPGSDSPVRLLDATLSGVITRQGELASDEREASAVTCTTDADCDDHKNCNGHEHCAPRTAGADARGCVKGAPMVCPVNQVCTEAHGCRGLDASTPPKPSSPTPPAVTP
jgi:hypothetical protein